jgi:hypothetical protein
MHGNARLARYCQRTVPNKDSKIWLSAVGPAGTKNKDIHAIIA